MLSRHVKLLDGEMVFFRPLKPEDAALYPDFLTDVTMPQMSGVELCRLLKSSYETAHVPVVLFSAMSNDELELLARECEADGFLSKANGLDQLPAELDRLIGTALF